MIEIMWWRFPLEYRLSLHAVFAAPLCLRNGSPSCYAVQLAIKRNASQLRTSIAFHVRQAPRMLFQAMDAYAMLNYQWNQLQNQERELVMGLLLDHPDTVTELPRLTSYNSLFCDYLYCLVADKNMARN